MFIRLKIAKFNLETFMILGIETTAYENRFNFFRCFAVFSVKTNQFIIQ